MSTPSFAARSRAWEVARTLKATITASDALASWMSDSVIWPTAECSTRTFTSSLPSLPSVTPIASAEPCTSAFTTTATSFCSPAWMRASMSVRLPRPAPAAAVAFSRSLRWRNSLTSRARASFSTAMKFSPAEGTPERPRISTGRDGPASFSWRPLSSSIARTRPHSAPATTMSPCFSVPFCTRTVATGPRPRSSLLSITVPSAARSGFALRSSTSACSVIASSSLSRLIFWVAETSISCVSPPSDSTTISCCSSSCFTRSGFTPGLSILFTATISGTWAARAWRIASIVWGITPSSAATTSTTMSVTEAPRARMAVKASWPGVSMKVTLSPDGIEIW